MTDVLPNAPADVLQIGRYQLQNLVQQDVRFLFIDLRSETERAEINDPLFKKAMPMTVETLKENLRINQVPLDAAILLMDQNGDSVIEIARDLESQSFKNVYVIRGGARQVASDLV